MLLSHLLTAASIDTLDSLRRKSPLNTKCYRTERQTRIANYKLEYEVKNQTKQMLHQKAENEICNYKKSPKKKKNKKNKKKRF